ncbi:hypothetical protein MTR67_042997 [Solanum verrucosum]|uniref:Uncharacterized protein n=1 Tax=Solanum verrucosum TaxID=315347 RepID=A0AAF0UNM4_SOLVR|nr:hypothetical protein MTR67_042997 [Solanum verrucosum]
MAPKRAQKYQRKYKPKLVAPLARQFIDEDTESSGSEFDLGITRNSPTTPRTMRQQARQFVFEREQSSSHDDAQSEEGAQNSNDKNRESQFGSSSDLVVASASDATRTGLAHGPPILDMSRFIYPSSRTDGGSYGDVKGPKYCREFWGGPDTKGILIDLLLMGEDLVTNLVDDPTIPASTTELDVHGPPSTSSGQAANTPQYLALDEKVCGGVGSTNEKVVEVKIQAVHQRIDVFELRIPERPQPRSTVDVASFHTELAKLRADIDAQATIVPEPALEDDADDVVLHALFDEDEPPLDPLRVFGKHTRTLGHTTYSKEERQTKKRER